MKKQLFFTGFLLCVMGMWAFAAFAAPKEIQYNGKTYYVVTSTDPTEDTGNEVCAKVGKACMGYTGLTNDASSNTRLHR